MSKRGDATYLRTEEDNRSCQDPLGVTTKKKRRRKEKGQRDLGYPCLPFYACGLSLPTCEMELQSDGSGEASPTCVRADLPVELGCHHTAAGWGGGERTRRPTA